jgi:hypothetical protein
MSDTLMIAGLGCAGLLLGSLFSFVQARAYIGRAHKAQGKVVKLVERSIGGGNHDFFPVFSFKDVNGQEVTVTQLSNRPRFKVGAEVEILFDPANPMGAKVNHWMNFYFFPALMGIVGIAVGLAGLISVMAQ